MSDKDMIERDVIREEIPNVPLLICLFHVLRSFKREVTTDKLGLSQDERILALELLQKMAYAKSEDSYNEFYQELKDTKLESVLRYFNKNWHPIKAEWVEGLKDNANNLMNNTNNRVESINQKLKGVISKFSNIVAFFDNLMKTVKSFRTERDHRAITIFQKVKINRFESNPSLSQYLAYVAPYAFGYIAKQMEASQGITFDGTISSNTVAVSLPSSEGFLTVTATTCECGFYKSMTLPCRHIFYFRRQSSLDEFLPDLAAYRWTKSYYKKNHVAFDNTHHTESNIQFTTTPRRRRVRVLSGQDKYRRVYTTTQQLARLVSDMPMRQFNEHVQKLERIVDILKVGKEYEVREVNQDDTSESKMTPASVLEVIQDEAYTPENIEIFDQRTDTNVNHSTSQASEPDQANMEGTSSTVNMDITPGNNQLIATDKLQSGSTTDEDQAVTSSDDFPVLTEPLSLKLPPKMVRRGRPKGAETTVIGLPRRTKRVLPFLKRQPKEKEEAMLSWILRADVDIPSIMSGNAKVVNENVILPQDFPTKILDENINITRIKKYFTPDAWQALKTGITTKKDIAEWNCHVCGTDVHVSASVVCDGCLEWFHQKCVGLKHNPKTTYWMYRRCSLKK